MLNKLTFLESLRLYLFEETHKKLQAELEVIYEDQAKLVIASEVGFYFKTKKYSRYTRVPPNYMQRFKPLHKTLHISMESYLKAIKQYEMEWDYISSYVRCLLNQCVTASQLYLALPSSLHGFLNEQGIEGSVEEHACDFDATNNQQGKEMLVVRLLLNMTGD